jgi:hypothetical protein
MFNIRDLFDIQNGEVVINEHILIIPKLRAVKDAYKDPLPAFKYLRYRYDLKGPYSDLPEDERDEVLMADYPGEYTLEDKCMLDVTEWLDSLLTPTQRYYKDCKVLLEKMGAFGRSTQITSGRDGNLSAFQAQLKGVGKSILEFKQLEKIVEQELEELSKSKNRGSQVSSYDED